MAFRLALSRDGESRRAQLGLARARRGQGDAEEAFELVSRLLAAHPEQSEAWLPGSERCDFWIEAARARAAVGSWEGTLDLLARPIGEGCRTSMGRAKVATGLELRASLQLAQAAERRGEGAVALDYYQRAVRVKPRSVQAQLGLARRLMEEDRRREAVDSLAEALRVRPRNRQIQNLMVSFLSE